MHRRVYRRAKPPDTHVYIASNSLRVRMLTRRYVIPVCKLVCCSTHTHTPDNRIFLGHLACAQCQAGGDDSRKALWDSRDCQRDSNLCVWRWWRGVCVEVGSPASMQLMGGGSGGCQAGRAHAFKGRGVHAQPLRVQTRTRLCYGTEKWAPATLPGLRSISINSRSWTCPRKGQQADPI